MEKTKRGESKVKQMIMVTPLPLNLLLPDALLHTGVVAATALLCLIQRNAANPVISQGAGKTTVVAPLLALMLADGESLVLSLLQRLACAHSLHAALARSCLWCHARCWR